MKKLFILPAFVLFITGATSTNVEPQTSRPVHPVVSESINTKIDSINIKTAELNELIKQL
jgi:hypothetical protein